jgi:conjugal transfer pilus assembly protein TraV
MGRVNPPILMLMLALAGCSNFGLGSSEYGCPGLPQGIQCMSARSAYTLTDNRETLEGGQLTPGQVNGQTDGATDLRSASDQMRGDTGPVIQAATLPAGPVPAFLPDGSVPVRAPAHVMRVWVAPYESKQGDLVMPGYLYTEVVPRRWQVGLPSPDSQRALTPLNAGTVRKEKAGS